jgi:hypothetical protein
MPRHAACLDFESMRLLTGVIDGVEVRGMALLRPSSVCIVLT